jgi:hypothetical protein
MSYQVIKSKAEGPSNDPVILSSEILDSGLTHDGANEVLYYEAHGYKRSGAQVIEKNDRIVIVDESDRAKYVLDIVEA